MKNFNSLFLTTLAWLAYVSPALADDESYNYPYVVAGIDGDRGSCYAKSIPKYIYDPRSGPRQQGHTEIYQVKASKDVLVQRYNWFSKNLFVICRPGNEIIAIRVGPWPHGRKPRADHLAIAFYRGAKLIRRYSTLDIADEKNTKTFSISASHYNIFTQLPKLSVNSKIGRRQSGGYWVVTAKTVDGRALVFSVVTGKLQ